MNKVRKSKRRLKKSVKVTGFALGVALTGITLITTIKHFQPSEMENITEDINQKEENSVSITTETIQNALYNYCDNNNINSSYIWKNIDETAYIISGDYISNERWELVDDNIFLQELVNLNYDQFSSYWVKEQQLMIKINNDYEYSSWHATDETRVVPDTVPSFVFEGDDKHWSLTSRDLVVNDEYNIFEFLQVYKNTDGRLFIGFEPNLDDGSDWEYFDSLIDFIGKHQYSYEKTKKGLSN